jgi:hypothetical protein
MLCEIGLDFCFALAVEATADVFYMLLPHGDVVRCVMYRSYLGKCNNSGIVGGVGVVKRRRVGSYRGASVTRKLRDDLHRVAPASGTSSASSKFEGTSPAARGLEPERLLWLN